MQRPPEWIRWLREEAASWVKEGFIDASQRDSILGRYPEPPPLAPPPVPASAKRKVPARARLPLILVGLAVLLIGTGTILFYAANWKRMTPAVKMAQVFALIVLTHGAAFYFLFMSRKWPALGRRLLFLGMLTFGAGIGLVVQTYHLSAHPAGCILLWATAVGLMSAVTRDRWGTYLAFALVLLWDYWERSVYGGVNYPMILAVLALFALALWCREVTGRYIAIGLAILWFYEVNLFYLDDREFRDAWRIFALMQIPFGCLLAGAAIFFRAKLHAPMAAALRVVGWILIYLPLVVLSWPLDTKAPFAWDLAGGTAFLWEFAAVALAAASLALALALRARGEAPWKYLATALLASGALLLLPLDRPALPMAVLLLALLAYHGASLLRTGTAGTPELAPLALLLACATAVTRSVGHFVIAFEDDDLFVAAGLSGLVFVAALFFLGEAVRLRAAGGMPTGKKTDHDVLAVFSLALGYAVLYAAAFCGDEQGWIFEPGGAPPDWALAMAPVAVVAVALWTHLFLARQTSRLLLVASGVTLALVLALILLPGSSVAATPRQLLLNAMLFFLAGSLIFFAVKKDSTALVNLGVTVIVVHILTRYFDVFWDMLHGSIFFLVTGFVLLAVASFMEWQRRILLKKMRGRAGGDGGETREVPS